MISSQVSWCISPQEGKQHLEQNSIQALDFNFDGSLIAVGVGKYIFLYTTIDGKLYRRLKGHRDQIYTLSYSHDGEFLASGGMDKCTIIWTKEGKGVLKFTHESSIQLLAFNPVEVLLASCSSFDVGFWSPKNQGVKKNKIDSKILSATWKPTGDILAMGLLSGSIHFINTNGIFQKSLNMGAPVWTLLWCSAKDGYNENVANCLVIGTWDSVVTYYDHANSNILSKIDVGGFPMTLTLLDAWPCPFIIVGTTSGAMKIINDKWVIVGDIATTEYDWPWCTKIYSSHYTHHNLAYIGNNGSIGLLKLDIDCLASAGGDDFVACSLDGTSIKILNNESVEISTVNINTHIHAIDLNDNTLVVVCKDRISIYSLVTDEKLKRLNVVLESDISLESSASFCKIVAGHNIVAIAFHTKISMYSINDGRKLRTWKVPCAITSISNYPGGCSGIGEILLLLACQDGWIFSLSLYTSSIDKILKVEKEAKIMARSRQNLIGIIDKDKQLLVYDIKDKCTRQQGELATDIVFHNQLESLYCYYTIEGSLKVRDGDAQASITPKCQGQIVKFTGCLIYLMDDGKLSTYKVNLAPIVKQKIQMKQFDRALSIARLGVESKIWEMIAHTALKNLNFDIFKECYIFLGKDYSEMSMIKRLKKDFEEFDSGNITKDHLQCLVTAEIDIVDGCIERAGEMFISLGCNERAIDLFLTQNMFHKAKLVPKQTTVQRNFILMSEAKWEEEFNNNYIRASELYAECGCFLKSVHAANKIEGDERVDRVCYISKLIPTTEIDALTQCYHYIQNDPRYFDDLKDILLKIEDYSLLISLYITRKSWIDVGTIWKDYKQKIVDKTIIFPYSDWLAGNGNIADALKVNREAGQSSRNRNLLSFLINDAIVQESYYELSKLLWQAALEARHSHDYSFYKEMRNATVLSNIYAHVNDFSLDIFSTYSSDVILKCCAYLLKKLPTMKNQFGMQIFQVLYLFSDLARNMNCFSSARVAYDMISKTFMDSLKGKQKEMLDDDMMTIEMFPMEDDERFHDVCVRCGSAQTMLHKKKRKHSEDKELNDFCDTCLHPFIRCMITMEVLPLIEFTIDTKLSKTDAISIMRACPPDITSNQHLFYDAIDLLLRDSSNTDKYRPVVVNEEILKSFNCLDVFAVHNEHNGSVHYFKNMIRDVGIAICPSCQNFFQERDFEYAYLKACGCPICLSPLDGKNYGHV